MIRRIISSSFIILLLIQCSESRKVIDWNKKEVEWRESLTVDPEYYQTVVEVTSGKNKTENIKKAETAAKLNFAEEIQVSKNMTGLWQMINLEERKIDAVHRTKKKILAEKIMNMKMESSLITDNSFFAAFSIDKLAFETQRTTEKNKAIDQARIKLIEGRRLMNTKEPQQAADTFCEALVAIEDYLGDSILVELEGRTAFLDEEIVDSMKELRESLVIQTDPKDTVMLNNENDFIGILNFEILQNEIKTGKINLSIDVAGMRQDKITVNGYSILVNDLPMKLRSPWVKIRADLFQNLRLNGNEITQLVYQQIPAIMAQIRIKSQFPTINVEMMNEGLWKEQASQMLINALQESGISVLSNSEKALKMIPAIVFYSNDEYGVYRPTGQWSIAIEGQEEKVKGARISTASRSEKTAQDDLLARLNEQMKDVIIDELLKVLSDSKNK